MTFITEKMPEGDTSQERNDSYIRRNLDDWISKGYAIYQVFEIAGSKYVTFVKS